MWKKIITTGSGKNKYDQYIGFYYVEVCSIVEMIFLIFFVFLISRKNRGEKKSEKRKLILITGMSGINSAMRIKMFREILLFRICVLKRGVDLKIKIKY